MAAFAGGDRPMLIIALCWAVALVIGGAVGIAGDADGEMNVLNVVVVASAAVLTLGWGALLAWHGRLSWLVVAVPLGGLVLLTSAQVAVAEDDDFESASGFFWIVYTSYVAILLLLGAVLGALASYLIRARRARRSRS
jgi:hypothetical protein